jgi:hypothetical protein
LPPSSCTAGLAAGQGRPLAGGNQQVFYLGVVLKDELPDRTDAVFVGFDGHQVALVTDLFQQLQRCVRCAGRRAGRVFDRIQQVGDDQPVGGIARLLAAREVHKQLVTIWRLDDKRAAAVGGLGRFVSGVEVNGEHSAQESG